MSDQTIRVDLTPQELRALVYACELWNDVLAETKGPEPALGTAHAVLVAALERAGGGR